MKHAAVISNFAGGADFAQLFLVLFQVMEQEFDVIELIGDYQEYCYYLLQKRSVQGVPSAESFVDDPAAYCGIGLLDVSKPKAEALSNPLRMVVRPFARDCFRPFTRDCLGLLTSRRPILQYAQAAGASTKLSAEGTPQTLLFCNKWAPILNYNNQK